MRFDPHTDKTVDLDAELKLFKRHIRVDEKTGCHVWTGAVKKDSGYARFQSSNAHRWMYKHTHGELKRHQLVTQTCGNRLCVNPDHLEMNERSPFSLRKSQRKYKRLYNKIFEVIWSGGGGSGRYIRIVAAKDSVEAVQLVFKDCPAMGKVAIVRELDIKPGIIAEYDFENEDYDG